MRTRMPALCFVVAAAALSTAISADAAPLTSATWLQVTQGVPMTRTTAQLGATGSSTASSVAVNLIYPQFTFSMFVPKQPNSVLSLHLRITQGGAQAITATAGMANANAGVPGTVVIRTAVHAARGVNASIQMVGGLITLLKVPLDIGVTARATHTFSVSGVSHTFTVDFFGWTPGAVTFTGLTSHGQPLPTVAAAGSFALNASGAGTVTLVAPTKVDADGPLVQRRTASLTTLKLSFVPEPGVLLLLGAAGLAGLTASRRAR